LTEGQVSEVLGGFSPLGELLTAADIANPNIAPETVVDQMLARIPCPVALESANQGAVYRFALHSVVQVLMLVAPVMEEWRKVEFSSTYELPRRVVDRLNQISGQMNALAQSGQAAAQLPEDRAVLYRLCVEGLLHNWDQRRGIHSAFGFDEKFRACRELAIAMQAHDWAEYEVEKVREMFSAVLGDRARAEQLLAHVRYRTGLLLKRRPNVFAFAHLTFQEYLAAQAIHEGNRLSVAADHLVSMHADARWREVIPLYCGVTTATAARQMIEQLLGQPSSAILSTILADGYLSASRRMPADVAMCRSVVEKIALGPEASGALSRFPADIAAATANRCVGRSDLSDVLSEAFRFLQAHSDLIDFGALTRRLMTWREATPAQNCELIYLLHAFAADGVLVEIASTPELYRASGLTLKNAGFYPSVGSIALIGIGRVMRGGRNFTIGLGSTASLLESMRTICDAGLGDRSCLHELTQAVVNLFGQQWSPADPGAAFELASLARRLAERLEALPSMEGAVPHVPEAINLLKAWAAHAAEETDPKIAASETIPWSRSLRWSPRACRFIPASRRPNSPTEPTSTAI
jgi:hypothetical protein